MSLEERRKRLKDLKARTKCQACGKLGHWAGDPECPLKSKKPQAKQQSFKRTGHLAAEESDDKDCSSCSNIDSSDDSVPEHRCGYMALKSSGSSSMHYKMSDSDDPDWEEEDMSVVKDDDDGAEGDDAALDDDLVPGRQGHDSVPERGSSSRRTRGAYLSFGKGKGRGVKAEREMPQLKVKKEDSDDSVPERQEGRGRPRKEKKIEKFSGGKW